MAPDGGASKPLVTDSPAVKRQKTVSGYNSTSNSGKNTGAYNSEDDSGDDLFAGFVPDTPGAAYQTQPTQILPRDGGLRSSSPDTPQRVVQVPASSPFSGRDSSPKSATNGALTSQQHNLMHPRTSLALSMAPAGTSYKPPVGVVTKLPLRKDVIIIGDDEEPEYQQISSDEEYTKESANIKPTKFTPGSASSSFGTSLASGLNGRTKFHSILAGSAYVKKPVQNVPSRAQPVSSRGSENTEEQVNRQIMNIRRVLPGLSEKAVRRALQEANMNANDAIEMLMSREGKSDIVNLNSDDDKEEPEQLTKGPGMSITEKYSTQRRNHLSLTTPPQPKKKKGTLVRGRRNPSSPDTPQISLASRPDLDDEEEQEASLDDSDSGVASDEEAEVDPEIEVRVLEFLNACSLQQLTDTTRFHAEDVEIMIQSRPFKTLHDAEAVSKSKIGKTGRKGKANPIGEKIVGRCTAMFASMDAVKMLSTRCDEISKPVVEEMQKWGVNVFGKSKDGKESKGDEDSKDDEDCGFHITSLGNPETSQPDSGLGSPSSGVASNNGDDDVDDVNDTIAKRKRNALLLEKPGMMAEDFTLKDYQIVGFNWLALMCRFDVSAILADDMGLGKTCQVISLLSHLIENGRPGPHIVVCPSSTLENWCREFEKFSPGIKILAYHGSQGQREHDAEVTRANLDSGNDANNINVVLTTYEMACKSSDNKFLRRLKADACVYDEGHMLKNPETKKYQQLMKIEGKFRLLLTGTPLQNNLRELVALLAFILPGLFKELAADLNFIFEAKATTRDTDHSQLLSKQRIDQARAILKPFILRRKKEHVLKHLPKKTSRVEYVNLHEAQKKIYDEYIKAATDRAKRIPTDPLGKSQSGKKKMDQNNPLMQLRKAAIHHLLFRTHFKDNQIPRMAELLRKNEPDHFPSNQKFDHLKQEMLNASDFVLHQWCNYYPCIKSYDIPDLDWMNSGKMEALVKLVKSYKENGDKVLIFSQFQVVLDIMEEVLETAAIETKRLDGNTPVDSRQSIIDKFSENDGITAFMLTTKAGGAGINLAAANKVIIFDGSFNPQDDEQAENRAHRLGQKRDVEVIRFITRGTVEEQIYALGESKLKLDSRVANGDDKSGEAVEPGEDAVTKMFLKGFTTVEELNEAAAAGQFL